MNAYVLALMLSVLGTTDAGPTQSRDRPWASPCWEQAVNLRSHNDAAEEQLEQLRPRLSATRELSRVRAVRDDVWLELEALDHWSATAPTAGDAAVCSALSQEAEEQLLSLEFKAQLLSLR